jgi:hypothetical protein
MISLRTHDVPQTTASEPVLPPGFADPVRPTRPRGPADTGPNRPIVQASVAAATPSVPVASPPAAEEQVSPNPDPVADSVQLEVLQSRLAAFQVASLGSQGLGLPVANAGARIEALAESQIEVKAVESLSTYG